MEAGGRLDSTERGHGVDQRRHLVVDGHRVFGRLGERLHDERVDAVAVNDDVINDDIGWIHSNVFVVDVLEEIDELELEDEFFRREGPVEQPRRRLAELLVVTTVFCGDQILKKSQV